jgi:enoyl-CoA hydratase/carnithine racemase
LFDTALAWARKLSQQAPLAVERIKRVSAAGDIDAGIEREKQAFLEVFTSEDGREGVSAFVEKRRPRFRGR